MAQTKTQTQTKKEILGPSVDYLPLQEGKFTNLLIYLYEGRSLPNTAKLLADFLGISEAEVNSKHNLLLGTYQGINTHCSDFLKPKEGTYDKSVFLAGDIVAYGNDAKDYYGGILDIIQEWKDGKKKEDDAKSEIKEILDDRRKEAEKFKNAAEGVYNGVQAFLSVTQKDQGALVRRESEYKTELAKQSRELEKLNKEVEKAQKELEAENQKALETLKPSFWKGLQLVGSGTIGALAYTQQVKNAIDKLKACRANLEKAQSEKNSVFRALTISGAVDASITQVNSLIGKALKELEAMAGIWSTLCKDFDTLLNTLNSKGVKEISKILTKLAVQSAIRQWEALRDKAKAYRDDAYSSGVTWYPTIDALLKAVG